jgi:hypothetical protein
MIDLEDAPWARIGDTVARGQGQHPDDVYVDFGRDVEMGGNTAVIGESRVVIASRPGSRAVSVDVSACLS